MSLLPLSAASDSSNVLKTANKSLSSCSFFSFDFFSVLIKNDIVVYSIANFTNDNNKSEHEIHDEKDCEDQNQKFSVVALKLTIMNW